MKRFCGAILFAAISLMPLGGYTQHVLAEGNTAAKQEAVFDLSSEKAQTLAGFPVKLPSLIPAGYILSLAYAPKDGKVVASYTGMSKKSFYVTMEKGEIAKESNGLTKVAFRQGAAYQGKKAGFGDMNVMLWEEEKGLIYQISGALSFEDLRKMAESVGKVSDQQTYQPAVKSMEMVNNLSLEEVSKLIGFPIKVPSYLPEGVELAYSYSTTSTGGMVYMFQRTSGKLFLSCAVYAGNATDEVGRFPNSEAVRQVKLSDGSVALLGNLPGTSFHEPDRTEWNAVIWQQARGVVYMMTSNLSYDEMIKIAESTKK